MKRTNYLNEHNKKIYNDMWLCHNSDDDIEIRDENMPLKITEIIKKEDLDPKRYEMQYGQHQGKNLVEINETNSAYIEWLKKNDNDLLLQQCIINLCQI